jgi:hypothetical protein
MLKNMNRKFLDIVLDKYQGNPELFSNKNFCYQMSNLEEYEKEGNLFSQYVSFIQWGKIPTKNILDKVKFIYISPPSQIEVFPFLKIISEMKNLKYIRLPLPYTLNLTKGDIPDALEYFHILNRKRDVESICTSKKEYTKKLLFPQIQFPNVKAFTISNLSYSTKVADYVKISKNNFPNLEYLSSDLSINLLMEFDTLKHLTIAGVDKINIFDFIKSNIESLHIEGAGKIFDLAEMNKKPSIEMIHFNSIHSDINCELFLNMPKLKEIYILNTPKIRNIEVLLNMKSLKSLEIINCKGSMNKTQKLMFKKQSEYYDRLEIDYAG